jgi:FAD/FMN-containing dehydrogenase
MAKAMLSELRDKVLGRVIEPGDAAYDEARRVYNGMIDRRPRAIVQPESSADVAAAVNYARDNGLDLAVRGGGHSGPGYGTVDDGVVIDFSSMKRVDVDPQTRTATTQAGATWADFDPVTHEHGLATTGGILGSTGVSGLTLGGGFGHLARGLGLSCDNLLSAEVVLADGRIVTANDAENEDLFWALRGGGGNFGVVTSFEFRVHPIAEVIAGPVFYELDDAANVMRFYRDYIENAPEQMGAFFGYQIAPPLPFIPEDRHGDTLCFMLPCWAGDPAQADAQLAPFDEAGKVVAKALGPIPYPALNTMFDPLLPAGLQHYWKAHFATELTDEAISAHAEHGAKVPFMTSTMHIYSINGAVHNVGATETAFAHREATFATIIAGINPDPADNEPTKKWVRDYYDATSKHSMGAGYINFMVEDDTSRIEDNYAQNFGRLRSLKAKFDPDNLFHLNQNIEPA